MKILVTGGSGFLGKEIILQLLDNGYHVKSFSRTQTNINSDNLEIVQGDLTSYIQVKKAVTNCDAIIHTAAKAGIWGDKQSFIDTNVIGTNNIIKATLASNIQYLVYTSSASVVFSNNNICGADESISYPKSFLAYYPESKMLAEKKILSAHGANNIQTISLRPHLIWGPNDPHFLPRLIKKYSAGKLFQIGDGKNLVDIIHVKNAAYAHLLALKYLVENKNAGGKAYFLGQEKPVNLWWFLKQLLLTQDINNVKFKKIPYRIARMLAVVFENSYNVMKINAEPPLTRFVASQLAKSHYFDHSAARRDFSYHPKIDIVHGLNNL